jgi:DeoR/GlpR family transcriptional regulator of sugar metabolism
VSSTGLSVAARREQIAQLARVSGLASVEALAARFAVTASTIRRDLGALAHSGHLARTYGGAIPLAHPGEPTLAERLGEAAAAKRAIARYGASCVRPGESVLLDAGTTVGALATELRLLDDLVVATTGLTAIEELAGHPTIRVECLGGTYRAVSKSFVGPLAESALEHLSFDRVFLGADGVRADRGICEAALEQTRLKELMARAGGAVVVLAHGDKIGRGAFHAWARLSPPWTLVTDESADEKALATFERAGIETVVVDAQGSARRRAGAPGTRIRRGAPPRAGGPARTGRHSTHSGAK